MGLWRFHWDIYWRNDCIFGRIMSNLSMFCVPFEWIFVILAREGKNRSQNQFSRQMIKHNHIRYIIQCKLCIRFVSHTLWCMSIRLSVCEFQPERNRKRETTCKNGNTDGGKIKATKFKVVVIGAGGMIIIIRADLLDWYHSKKKRLILSDIKREQIDPSIES